MSQKFSGVSKNPKLKWSFKTNDDGTVNFTVQARKLRVREVRGRFLFEILSWVSALPLNIQLDGHSVRTRAVVKLFSTISQKDRPSLEWGKLHKLANKKCKTSNT